jgi:hypothetical protein
VAACSAMGACLGTPDAGPRWGAIGPVIGQRMRGGRGDRVAIRESKRTPKENASVWLRGCSDTPTRRVEGWTCYLETQGSPPAQPLPVRSRPPGRGAAPVWTQVRELTWRTFAIT